MKLSRAQLLPFLLPFAVSLLIAFLSAGGFLSRWQEQALDWQFRWRGARQPPREIVIVAIDDESLKQVGAWAWRRSLHAELVRRIARAGARVMAFDVVFAEPTPDDAALAQAAQDAGNVLFAVYFSRKSRGVFAGYAPTVERPTSSVVRPSELNTQDARRKTQFPFAEGAQYPVPTLRKAAAGVGHVNVFPELDGVLRRAPLFIAYPDGVASSLPLVIAEHATRNTFHVSRFANSHGEILLNTKRIGCCGSSTSCWTWRGWRQDAR
jgi:CHASE2 domain-containing sensor protein